MNSAGSRVTITRNGCGLHVLYTANPSRPPSWILEGGDANLLLLTGRLFSVHPSAPQQQRLGRRAKRSRGLIRNHVRGGVTAVAVCRRSVAAGSRRLVFRFDRRR